MIDLLIGLVSFLCGMVVMGIMLLKDHDADYERAYSLGKRHGMELIMIRKATDKEVWGFVHEEVSGDGNCQSK